MARIAGVNIPSDKHIEISMTYIYGIGRSLARKILDKVKIDYSTKTHTLSEDQLDLIRDEIKRLASEQDENGMVQLVEGDLRRQISNNIKRLQEINCYRGVRHKKRLPVRGQSTKTNAKTRKGKSVAIAGKKK
ncbi:MAG: 30S ribosomal protein S13 [Candidatus Gracilibacteria bacterium]|nr:30S ribosomal protein S13 [Candidatus Gracilibacteria bacterium]